MELFQWISLLRESTWGKSRMYSKQIYAGPGLTLNPNPNPILNPNPKP